MSDAPLPGPLDEFLEHPPRRPESAELRGDLLRRTTATVRRRRRARRLSAVAAIAAAILVVAMTVWLTRRAGEEPEPQPGTGLTADRHDVPHVNPEPAIPDSHGDTKPAPVAPPNPAKALPSAVALEWQAFDAPRPQRAALYQRAGDRYFEEERDLASAVRCYGQAVQAAPTVEFDANDNWLVMAMKLDEIERRKEP